MQVAKPGVTQKTASEIRGAIASASRGIAFACIASLDAAVWPMPPNPETPFDCDIYFTPSGRMRNP
jgi:hypothetical protein